MLAGEKKGCMAGTAHSYEIKKWMWDCHMQACKLLKMGHVESLTPLACLHVRLNCMQNSDLSCCAALSADNSAQPDYMHGMQDCMIP